MPASGAGTSGGGVAGGGVVGSTAGDDGFGNPTMPAVMVGDGLPSDGEDCLEPTVALVIDGSGSMCEVFGGSTRWRELRSILLTPMTGLIHRLTDRVAFGLMLYDGNIDATAAGMATGGTPSPACAGFGGIGRMGGADQCPQLIEVPPGRSNAGMINQAYPMTELGGSTPTDKAMNAQVDKLIAGITPGEDLAKHPRFIILATDGQPNDICTGGLGGDGTPQQAGVIAAVDRAVGAGIRTFVISLANGDPVLEAHLTMVAQHGDPGNAAAHTFTPATPDDLNNALTTVLGTALGCNVL